MHIPVGSSAELIKGSMHQTMRQEVNAPGTKAQSLLKRNISTTLILRLTDHVTFSQYVIAKDICQATLATRLYSNGYAV